MAHMTPGVPAPMSVFGTLLRDYRPAVRLAPKADLPAPCRCGAADHGAGDRAPRSMQRELRRGRRASKPNLHDAKHYALFLLLPVLSLLCLSTYARRAGLMINLPLANST